MSDFCSADSPVLVVCHSGRDADHFFDPPSSSLRISFILSSPGASNAAPPRVQRLTLQFHPCSVSGCVEPGGANPGLASRGSRGSSSDRSQMSMTVLFDPSGSRKVLQRVAFSCMTLLCRHVSYTKIPTSVLCGASVTKATAD